MQSDKKCVQLKLEDLITTVNASAAVDSVPVPLTPKVNCLKQITTLKLDELLPPVADGDVYIQLNLSELIQRPSHPYKVDKPLLLSEMLSAETFEIVTTPEFSLERELFGLPNSTVPASRIYRN